MMTIFGVGTSNSSNSLPFQEQAKARLTELSLQYRKYSEPPLCFKEFGFGKAEFQNCLDEIKAQFYRVQGIQRGERRRLNSVVALKHGAHVDVVCKPDGSLEFLLHGSSPRRYYVINDKHEEWLPIVDFKRRVQFFKANLKQQTPALPNYSAAQLAPYFDVAERVNLDKVPAGHYSRVAANPAANRPFAIRIYRDLNDDFKLLLEQDEDNFIRLDSYKSEHYNKYFHDKKTAEFIQRIKDARKELPSLIMQPEFAKVLTKPIIDSVYEYLLDNKTMIKNIVPHQGMILPKEVTGLARTIEIVRDAEGNMVLLVMNKKKLADGSKDPNQVIAVGSYGKLKPATRIDSHPFEEWVDKTANKEDLIRHIDMEAFYSLHMYEMQEGANPRTAAVSVSSVGMLFSKAKKTAEGVAQEIEIKQGNSAPRAIGDLRSLFVKDGLSRLGKLEPQYRLSDQEKYQLLRSVLEKIKEMHRQGKVHQDIKLENILVYKDGNGYYTKLTDFGISFDPLINAGETAKASHVHESPEIVLAHAIEDAPCHEFFHKKNNQFYKALGYLQYLTHYQDYKLSPIAQNFRKPHAANDMFSLGIMIYEMKYFPKRVNPSVAECMERINADPLMRGLLQPKRNERMTINQAIQVLESQCGVAYFATENSIQTDQDSNNASQSSSTASTSTAQLKHNRLK